MDIWVLNVINASTPDWEASTYKGKVVVRAPSEHAARGEACSQFCIATERKLGETVKINPWSQSALVSCEKYTGNEYSEDGGIEVLCPSFT